MMLMKRFRDKMRKKWKKPAFVLMLMIGVVFVYMVYTGPVNCVGVKCHKAFFNQQQEGSFDGSLDSATPLHSQLHFPQQITANDPPTQCCRSRSTDLTCVRNCTCSKHPNIVRELGNEAFFVETSLSPSLNYRQACSVESFALTNPKLRVNLLMTALDLSSPTISILRNYANVNVIEIDPGDVFMGTPLQYWYFCTDWRTSKYVIEHLSDALRYTLLFLYGGYYFDLDVVSMHPVSGFRNFTAIESRSELAAGAMHFSYKHPIIVDMLEEFRISYSKFSWNGHSQGSLNRVLKRYCHVQEIHEAVIDGRKPCTNFTILTPSSFYPIHYSHWIRYFQKNSDTENIFKEWERRKVLGAHIWNKLNAKNPVFKGAGQLYGELARQYCPLIYSAASDPF